MHPVSTISETFEPPRVRNYYWQVHQILVLLPSLRALLFKHPSLAQVLLPTVTDLGSDTKTLLTAMFCVYLQIRSAFWNALIYVYFQLKQGNVNLKWYHHRWRCSIANTSSDPYLIIVTTLTTWGGVLFSSRRTFSHRERERDCF